MKGVTRVTASLLAAAMTAGLGTTAVFADGASTGKTVSDKGDDTSTVEASWIEVMDKDEHVLASTDPDDAKYWDLTDTSDKEDKNVTKPATGVGYDKVQLVMSAGGVKALTVKLDDKTTATPKLSFFDADGSGTISKKDIVGPNYEAATTGVPETDVVSLDGTTLTANKAGYAKLYAYPSGTVKKDDNADSSSVRGTNVIEIDVQVVDTTNTFALEYVDRDTVFTNAYLSDSTHYDNGVTELEGITKLSDIKTPDPAISAKKLKNDGSKIVTHKDDGETAEFKITAGQMRDDSDSNSKLKFKVSDSRYLSVDGTTVTVKGTAPKKGFGTFVMYYDANGNGKLDLDEEEHAVSNSLYVFSHEGVKIYRVYNPNSGEHVYTKDADEKDNLVSVGWQYEGIGWYAPEKSASPVYRVYNPVAGEHLYTTDESEVKNLVAHGWNDEGVKFYSATNRYYPLYREYNPNAFANNHNYTGSVLENTWLVSLGWKAEGVKLYAVELDNATIQSASSEAAEEGNYEENSQWGL